MGRRVFQSSTRSLKSKPFQKQGVVSLSIKYTGGGARALSFLIKGKPNIEDFIVCFRCVNEWLLVNQISHFKHSELPNS